MFVQEDYHQKELKNRGIECENQNKWQKLIYTLDEELKHETLANIEGDVYDYMYMIFV